MSLKVIVHESGRKSILRSDIAGLRVFRADGTEDLPIEEHAIGKFTQKEAEAIMKLPQNINLKKLSRGVLKRFKRSGRQ